MLPGLMGLLTGGPGKGLMQGIGTKNIAEGIAGFAKDPAGSLKQLPSQLAGGVQNLAEGTAGTIQETGKQLAQGYDKIKELAKIQESGKEPPGGWETVIPGMLGLKGLGSPWNQIISIGGPILLLLLLSKLFKSGAQGLSDQEMIRRGLDQFDRLSEWEKRALWAESVARRNEFEKYVPALYKAAAHGCKTAPRTSRIAKTSKPDKGKYGKGHQYQGSTVKKAEWVSGLAKQAAKGCMVVTTRRTVIKPKGKSSLPQDHGTPSTNDMAKGKDKRG